MLYVELDLTTTSPSAMISKSLVMFNNEFTVYSPANIIILPFAISTAFSMVFTADSFVLPSLVSKPLFASTYIMIESTVPLTVRGISLNALAEVM